MSADTIKRQQTKTLSQGKTSPPPTVIIQGAGDTGREGDTNLKGATTKDPLWLAWAQWNCQSLQAQHKIDFINLLAADILCLQEILAQENNVNKVQGEVLHITQRHLKRGGGTACLSNSLHTQVLQRFDMNKDSSALKVRINTRYFAWIITIYHHSGSHTKIQKTFGMIKQKIPTQEWKTVLIMGDFNIDAQKNHHDFRSSN